MHHYPRNTFLYITQLKLGYVAFSFLTIAAFLETVGLNYLSGFASCIIWQGTNEIYPCMTIFPLPHEGGEMFILMLMSEIKRLI